ncbi:MAG: glycosyltransferase family 2 protein [Candidatus Limnocylindrales bacterium]|jgi:glycosyltransferase involved in cell wall biosynthesis
MPDGDAEPQKYSFTVFTPTYNRAATLARVYESLQRQTLRDFEWLILDDGSEDGTAELVERWRAASSFPIRYVWQRNQGKHVAFNRGVGLARGELFLTIDSDDECVPVALERLMYHWNEIPSASRSCFAAVTGLCMDQNGRIIGDRFPRDVLDSNSIELVYRYKVRGDKWGFTRTDILRDFPFPADGTKFIPESVVWDEIATKYSTRYVNEVMLIAWIRPRAGSRERSEAASLYARGLARWNLYVLNRHLGWFRYDPIRFVLSAVRYTRFSSLDRQSPLEQLHQLRSPGARLLWLLTLPLGAAAVAVDVKRVGRSGAKRRVRL